MTEQEVIKEFEERLAIADYRDNIPKYYKAMELAIKDMKEIQKYRAIGTPDKIKEELDHLRNDNDCQGLYFTLEERQDLARQHRELEEYRAIGTVEELQKAEKEEDILKFYYCDSEDSYLVGLRIGNFYYAHYIDGRWVFDMSRHLPWGEHVVDDTTEWKEHTYPSEPKEINFSEWLNGFIKKNAAAHQRNVGRLWRNRNRRRQYEMINAPALPAELIMKLLRSAGIQFIAISYIVGIVDRR